MKNKKFKKLKIFVVTIFFISITALTAFVFLNPWGMGFKEILSLRIPKSSKNIKVEIPEKYFAKISDNRIFSQGYNQCGAFSSSFVLRNLGVEVYGGDIYGSMTPKMKNGYLLPDALISLFKKNGFKAILRRGNLEDLKRQLLKGKPVIVVIGRGFNWQHYIVVTGFDKDNIYTVDSLLNYSEGSYNKKYSNFEFTKLWNNELPIFNSLYIDIE